MRREIISAGSLAKIEADFPVPGFYAVRLIKDGPLLPLRIFVEREFDEAGDQMADDVVRCLVDGREADWRRYWPFCAAKPITAAQYERMRLNNVHEPTKAFDPSSTRVSFRRNA